MKKLLLLSFLFISFVNCKDIDDVDPDTVQCTLIACTEQFVTLIVTVKDASGVLIPLDTFEVTDKNTSDDITISLSESGWQMARQNGQYPLYDDSFVSGNLNTRRTLIFKGFIKDEKIAEAEYVVETDCCHVNIAIGDTDITIN